jgi:UDP-GlcNAc:undecaprenyl-phosphate GlcNAc-1-phosphate transferase
MEIQEPNIVWLMTFFAIGCIFFSFIINLVLLKFFRNLMFRNTESDKTAVRWASQSKPPLGGISFYIIFLISLIVYFIFFKEDSAELKSIMGLLVCTSLAFLMGLADDAYDTKPLLKLTAQILCGIVLIMTDTYIRIFPYEILNYLLTVFWVTGMMNSINMLDNMDAITGGVSFIIILSALFMLFFSAPFNALHAFIFVGVASAIAGFLYYNWHPSKIYMGDTGSQFLGALLATIGIMYYWNGNSGADESLPLKNLLCTLLVFLMPIIDTTIVVINRISRKQSPFVGGKDHTTHALAKLGLGDRKVAITFIGITIISICLALYLNAPGVQDSTAVYLLGFSYILAVFSVFFLFTKNKKISEAN